MKEKTDIWYIYAIDEEGDLVFIRKNNKPVIIGGKEEKPTITTTDIPENAQNYYEISDARAMISYIRNNEVEIADEYVDPENFKIAYKDQYDNFYDKNTDKCIFINNDGDELEESMNVNEAKHILNESGYEMISLNEGWTSAYDWQTPEDVKEALKFEEISSDYEFIKNFGNFFCYKRKKDGRPIVTYYLIRKIGHEYGYKDIGLDSSLKYNPSLAKWLKVALLEYGTTEENPGDVKHYWDYINSGTQARQDKKEKDDIKYKLKDGSKVQMNNGFTVIYDRPYNNQSFAGHVDGETDIYKWYYRNIKELISESWNTKIMKW